MNTDDAARQIAAFAGVNPSNIGIAGRKDRHAVTTQWLSLPSTDPQLLMSFSAEGIKVLEAVKHGNKLRTGHLKGNRFQIVVRDVVADALVRARAVVEQIEQHGLPNIFGNQRFGAQNRNVAIARGWIVDGRRRPKNKRKCRLLVSALQSEMFNDVVRERLQRGLFTSALAGDVMKKHDSGGMFSVEDPTEVAERIEAKEISPTGPIFGARMWWPELDALELEEGALARAELTKEHLERFRKFGKGTRRLLRVFPQNIGLEQEGDVLTVSFYLESGSYATTFLDEIMKPDSTAASPP